MMPTMTLAETPGGYYMFAYWLAALSLCVTRMPRRLGVWKTVGLSILTLGALEAWVTLTRDIPVVAYVPSVTLCMAMVFAFILASCRLNAAQAGYYTVQVVVLGEFAASLEWQIYYYLSGRWSAISGWALNAACLAVIHACVFVPVWLLVRRQRGSGNELRVRFAELATVVTIGVGTYALSNISYVFSDTPFSATVSAELFAIRTMTDFAGVALLFVFDLQMRERGMEAERMALRSMLRMQYASYRISKDSMDLVNRKYHDLKHQIALLRAEGGDVQGHLDRLERQIGVYEATSHTGNDVLDTMLTIKTEQCRRQGIQLTCVAQGEALGFIDPMDLSSLLGNALDNAIEATSKVEDEVRRTIHCTVAERRGFVQIEIDNSCTGPVRFIDGLPRSTKGDDANHGFGMRSMRQVAQQYGGSLTAAVEDGRFTLRLLIPMPRKTEEADSSRRDSHR